MSDMIDDPIDAGAGAPGADPAAPAAPPAQGDGNQGDRLTPPQQGWIPPHRFSEVTGNLRTVQDENRQLRQQIETLTSNFDRMQNGLNTALGNNPAEHVDPQVARIREQMLTVFPELRAVVENAKAVSTMIEQFPTVQGHMTATNEQLAAAAFGQIDELLAPMFAGEDGKIPAFARRQAQQGFIDYLQSDEKAFQRYTRGDRSLVSEWFGRFDQDFVSVIRRNALASAQNRGQRVASLPRSGPATSVTPSARPPQAPKTIDEAIDRAWESLQSE